jgi:hypothetical protein
MIIMNRIALLLVVVVGVVVVGVVVVGRLPLLGVAEVLPGSDHTSNGCLPNRRFWPSRLLLAFAGAAGGPRGRSGGALEGAVSSLIS